MVNFNHVIIYLLYRPFSSHRHYFSVFFDLEEKGRRQATILNTFYVMIVLI